MHRHQENKNSLVLSPWCSTAWCGAQHIIESSASTDVSVMVCTVACMREPGHFPWLMHHFHTFPSSLVAQMVKRLLTMQETRVRSLDWEDPLKKEMATHSSTLAWKIPWTEEPGRLHSMGLQSRTRLSDFTFTFQKHPGLISFKMGWLDLLAVQGTLKSLLQHHSSKASIL